jgi:hypothetical protein
VHFHIACKSVVRVCLHVVHDIDGFVVRSRCTAPIGAKPALALVRN